MDDIELIQAFVVETQEAVDEIEPLLIEMQELACEDAMPDTETINAIFRVFHSTKGSAGFLQLGTVSSVTHEAETLLDMIRKGKMDLEEHHVLLMLQSCDFIRALLTEIEQFGTDHGNDEKAADLVEELQHCMRGTQELSAAKVPAAPESVKTEPAPVLDRPCTEATNSAGTLSEIASPDMIDIFVQDAEDLLENAEQALIKLSQAPDDPSEPVQEGLRAIHTFKGNSGLLGLTHFEQLSHRMETIMQAVRDGELDISDNVIRVLLSIIDLFRKSTGTLSQGNVPTIMGFQGLSELLDEFIPSTVAPPEVSSAPDTAPPAPAEEVAAAPARAEPPPERTAPNASEKRSEKTADKQISRAKAAQTVARRDIRVNVDKLDLLHNLVGELVIAEAMVTRNAEIKKLHMESFERAGHQLSLITNELQDVAMSLRMIPLAGVFRKMIRLVHDLSSKAHKKIDLKLIGEETEVDRNVVELISDPLVHLIRNSVDHGLEPQEDREKAGKPESGQIIIEARHQSGEVWILVKDDGRGLNRQKILERAKERGLCEGDGSHLRDDEVYRFVFMPGFSTAEAITDISGRGVGMDVVKKNIEKLKGHIDIESTPGKGSTIIIRIPLTLAIIQGMLLQAGNERYVIPLLNIRESFRPDSSAISTVTGRGEMITIRGELLPLFRLATLFSIKDAVTHAAEGIVVVIEDGPEMTALLVDELLGQQQVVIKSLDNVGVSVQGVSGACILNDGRVGLILDVRGMIHLALHEKSFAV